MPTTLPNQRSCRARATPRDTSPPGGEPPTLDLFAGAGGLSIGIAAAGLRPIRAVEVMSEAAATYEAAHDFEVDRRRLEDIPERELRSWGRDVQIVVGGPPCQPWSVGGLRLADKDSRDGFPAMCRALRLIAPEAFVIENVAGLERAVTRQYFLALIDVLEGLGYEVAAETLDAADFGVPQHRRRTFIVGMRGRSFRFPDPTHGPTRSSPWVTAGDVLTLGPVGEPNNSIVTYAKRPHIRPSPYDGLLFNGGGRPINLAAPARTILASAGGNKTPFIDIEAAVPEYHDRLWDAEDGKPRKAWRRRVRSGRLPGARRLTVEESAALQSLPPGMEFKGTKSTQYTLVGNAVPPRLAAAVAGELRSQLAIAPG
jgi:DNA (cytosine-5)-methyltransferase 1